MTVRFVASSKGLRSIPARSLAGMGPELRQKLPAEARRYKFKLWCRGGMLGSGLIGHGMPRRVFGMPCPQ
jgi:predicted alpha/beta hydrolase